MATVKGSFVWKIANISYTHETTLSRKYDWRNKSKTENNIWSLYICTYNRSIFEENLFKSCILTFAYFLTQILRICRLFVRQKRSIARQVLNSPHEWCKPFWWMSSGKMLPFHYNIEFQLSSLRFQHNLRLIEFSYLDRHLRNKTAENLHFFLESRSIDLLDFDWKWRTHRFSNAIWQFFKTVFWYSPFISMSPFCPP